MKCIAWKIIIYKSCDCYSFIRFLIYLHSIHSVRRKVDYVQLEIVVSPISIPILVVREPMKLITLSRCLPSFERKSRTGEEMRLPFLADASRHVYGCGVECISSSIALSLSPRYIEKQGPGERREIRTSGLIKDIGTIMQSPEGPLEAQWGVSWLG